MACHRHNWMQWLASNRSKLEAQTLKNDWTSIFLYMFLSCVEIMHHSGLHLRRTFVGGRPIIDSCVHINPNFFIKKKNHYAHVCSFRLCRCRTPVLSTKKDQLCKTDPRTKKEAHVMSQLPAESRVHPEICFLWRQSQFADLKGVHKSSVYISLS